MTTRRSPRSAIAKQTKNDKKSKKPSGSNQTDLDSSFNLRKRIALDYKAMASGRSPASTKATVKRVEKQDEKPVKIVKAPNITTETSSRNLRKKKVDYKALASGMIHQSPTSSKNATLNDSRENTQPKSCLHHLKTPTNVQKNIENTTTEKFFVNLRQKIRINYRSLATGDSPKQAPKNDEKPPKSQANQLNESEHSSSDEFETSTHRNRVDFNEKHITTNKTMTENETTDHIPVYKKTIFNRQSHLKKPDELYEFDYDPNDEPKTTRKRKIIRKFGALKREKPKIIEKRRAIVSINTVANPIRTIPSVETPAETNSRVEKPKRTVPCANKPVETVPHVAKFTGTVQHVDKPPSVVVSAAETNQQNLREISALENDYDPCEGTSRTFTTSVNTVRDPSHINCELDFGQFGSFRNRASSPRAVKILDVRTVVPANKSHDKTLVDDILDDWNSDGELTNNPTTQTSKISLPYRCSLVLKTSDAYRRLLDRELTKEILSRTAKTNQTNVEVENEQTSSKENEITIFKAPPEIIKIPKKPRQTTLLSFFNKNDEENVENMDDVHSEFLFANLPATPEDLARTRRVLRERSMNKVNFQQAFTSSPSVKTRSSTADNASSEELSPINRTKLSNKSLDNLGLSDDELNKIQSAYVSLNDLNSTRLSKDAHVPTPIDVRPRRLSSEFDFERLSEPVIRNANDKPTRFVPKKIVARKADDVCAPTEVVVEPIDDSVRVIRNGAVSGGSDADESRNDDTREGGADEIHLFEDNFLVQPVRRNYCKKKTRNLKRKNCESDASDDDSPRKPAALRKKRKKNQLTKKEEMQANEWAEKFNSMCEEIEGHNLVIE